MTQTTQPAYRRPAEWEPHAATLLAWPQRPELWSGRYEIVTARFADIAHAVAPGETVLILVNDARAEDAARAVLEQSPHYDSRHAVEFLHIPTDDVWIRDYGPLRMLPLDGRNDALSLDFRFNGWGGKYEPHVRDDAAAALIIDKLNLRNNSRERILREEIFIEGGALECNGGSGESGVMITTRQCLLHENRNPRLTFADVDALLRRRFGVGDVLWLEAGLPRDDTDGHVDMITRFTGSRRILSATAGPGHPAREILSANYRKLSEWIRSRDDGSAWELLELPMPQWTTDGPPYTHANFYVTNTAVLVPTFAGASDREAEAILATLFPEHRIVGVDAREIMLEGGGIHCLTMELPRHSG